MLVVGLFAVLSWDSTFPEPARRSGAGAFARPPRTIFLAKVAASRRGSKPDRGRSQRASQHHFADVIRASDNGGLLGLILSLLPLRCFAAYWITMLSAGAHLSSAASWACKAWPRNCSRAAIFCGFGVFANGRLLPVLERVLSGAVAEYTEGPHRPGKSDTPGLATLLLVSRTLSILNGIQHPALAPLANRALAGLGDSGLAAPGPHSCCPISARFARLWKRPTSRPARGAEVGCRVSAIRFETAIVQFSIRTLLRSRQHRVILAFYWGLGGAIITFVTETRFAHQKLNVPMLFASVVMMLVAVLGTRIVFSMPLEVRANWVFRLAPLRGGAGIA